VAGDSSNVKISQQYVDALDRASVEESSSSLASAVRQKMKQRPQLVSNTQLGG